MNFISMFMYYICWHYTSAIVDLVYNYLILVSWLKNFFSLNHLSRNLFAPWRRLGEEYPTGFDLFEFLSSLLVNILMRMVGLVIRLIFILVGLLSLVVSLVIFGIVFVVWSLMPVILLFLVILGFRLLLA